MASSRGDKFSADFAEALGLETLRREHLEIMDDEIAKAWILQLLREIKSLRNTESELLKITGNSAFNPTRY